jgi:hypothetical protein
MNNQVKLWANAFEYSLKKKAAFKARLLELQTWDKPIVNKENDNNGKWNEYHNKIQALEFLISIKNF